jgi:RNA polymerase sigma factor (sigma-70 family)
MSNDTELLRRFVDERAEGPFAELVRQHLNLVYSAALREMNGDGAMAEDVSQAVFTELAREAPRLVGHPSLAGWLYTTVRHLAANWRRADQHRRRREEEAHSMNQLLSEDSPNEAWQQVRPVLDDALHELNAADREAVVLRFMEDRPLREVGARLGLNENAARMRVDRALDKLRGQLARRGITSTASGLTAALAIGVLTPAPAALAGTIASTALASGAVADSTTLTLMKTQPELLRLRGMAGVARQANLEAEQLRAQFAKQASEGGTNPFTAPMLDFQKQARARRLETDLSALTARLHLTPEQSQAAHDILLRQAQVDYAAMELQYATGKIDKEEIARLKTGAGDPDTQIQELLTPDQQAAYARYKQEKTAQSARWAASASTADLQGNLNLTSEQADRAFAALYQVSLAEFTSRDKSGAQDPAADHARWMDQQQAKALESILTPAQLDSLRQSQAALAKTAKDFYSKIQGSRGSK